ncbi:MAG: iron dependent repressor, metal binding and dimerization domain protein [Candidatus Thermoplasmatota archaeon]|nr:iron dependent repressor, metal binding and dimerization domain protein [Candidatus Thermoplasmatota archaeon]
MEEQERLEGLKSAHIREMQNRNVRVSTRIEDFLEIIVELEDIHGEARVSDIASNLAISRPTVVRMLGKMAKEGWIEKNPYRPVKLCPKGRQHAEWMRERHGILFSFLRHLGIDETTAHHETEGIEHHLSESTVKTIENLIQRLQQ